MNKNIIYAIVGISGLALILTLIFKGSSGPTGDQSGISFKDAIGKTAPDFTLPDINSNDVSLGSLKGKNVILFFNEGLRCYPACFDQVIKLSEDSRLNNDEIKSFSVVVDSIKSWKDAEKKMPSVSGAKILFDKGGNVSQKYGVLTLASSMRKGMAPGHTYIIIDKEGIVQYVLDDPRMGIRNDLLAAEIEKLEEKSENI